MLARILVSLTPSEHRRGPPIPATAALPPTSGLD